MVTQPLPMGRVSVLHDRYQWAVNCGMAQNSKYKRCNDNTFLVSAGGTIVAIRGMRDVSFDTRSLMCTAFY
jgi:hypothetical protein